MPITTLSNEKNNKVGTILVYALGIVGVGLVVFFAGEIIKNFDKLKGKSALNVASLYGQYDVLVNGQSVGKTPVDSKNIKPGQNRVTVKNEASTYDTNINFLPSDGKYIHTVGLFVDLGTSDIFSSAQSFWFEKESSGAMLRVISEPAGATISIDKTEFGKTPFSSNTIGEGEYDLKIELAGYETQTARVNLKKGFTVNVNIKMFPMPVPNTVKLFAESQNLYDLTLDNNFITADTKSWTAAIIYWNKTRGMSIAGATPTKDMVFDYYVDYKGNTYDYQGNAVTNQADFAKLKGTATTKGAYLGRTSDGTGITEAAKEVLTTIGVSSGAKMVKIKATGTGWLRVRKDASTAAAEVTKVNTGETKEMIEQKSGWTHIKVSEGVDGWVSSDYVEVLTNAPATSPTPAAATGN